jgi:hypothetical protein
MEALKEIPSIPDSRSDASNGRKSLVQTDSQVGPRTGMDGVEKRCKGKTFPVTGRGDPLGCETSRLSHFLDNRLTDGGEVVGLTHRTIGAVLTSGTQLGSCDGGFYIRLRNVTIVG